RDALQMQMRLYPQEQYPWGHLEQATTLNNLAIVNWHQGEYAKAESLLRQSIEIKKQVLGEQNPSYAPTVQNLAALVQATNLPEEAWQLAVRTMELNQRHLQSVFAFASEATMRAHLDSTSDALPLFLNHGLHQAGSREPGTTTAYTWTLRRKGVLLDAVCRF